MAEAPVKIRLFRPAEDIAEDIATLIRRFPPLGQSRYWFTYEVQDGTVTLRGNIKSAIAQRVLLDNVPHIPGVVAVHAQELHSDEALRRQIGQIVPPGVLVHVDFGRVVLNGPLPPRRKPEALIGKIARLDGVRRVESQLS